MKDVSTVLFRLRIQATFKLLSAGSHKLDRLECVCCLAAEPSIVAAINGYIATLDLEERPILEDGPSGLIKSDLTLDNGH